MARKDLFAKQTISGFASDALFGGLYSRFFYFPESGEDSNLTDPFSIEVGETCFVDWDGTEYEVVAQDSGDVIAGSVVLGNAADFGLSGNGEPFGIMVTDVDVTFVCMTDTATSHTIGIYQEVAAVKEENYRILGSTLSAIANAVRDKTGRTDPMYPTEFADAINDISVGSDLEILEDVPVEPDFSNGDFTLSAPDGYAVKSAIVQKPDTLKPENILSGVNIAGIIGAAVAGGGGGNVIVKNGTFTAGSSPTVQTITHGLGCRPDVLIVYMTEFGSKSGQITSAVGLSKALCTAGGLPECGFLARHGWGSNTYTIGYDFSETRNQYIHDMYGYLFANDDKTFQIGPTNTSQATLKPSTTYKWIAIGGLT